MTGTEAVRPPEVPVIVAVYVPGATVPAEVKVTGLDEVVLVEPKVALMPAGKPETDRSTVPAKPPA